MIKDSTKLNSVRHNVAGEMKISTFNYLNIDEATLEEQLVFDHRAKNLKYLSKKNKSSKILLPQEDGCVQNGNEYFIWYEDMGRPFCSIQTQHSEALLENTKGDPYNLSAEGLVDTGSALEEIHAEGLVHGCLDAAHVLFLPKGNGKTKLVLPHIIQDGEKKEKYYIAYFPQYDNVSDYCTKFDDIIAYFILILQFTYSSMNK